MGHPTTFETSINNDSVPPNFTFTIYKLCILWRHWALVRVQSIFLMIFLAVLLAFTVAGRLQCDSLVLKFFSFYFWFFGPWVHLYLLLPCVGLFSLSFVFAFLPPVLVLPSLV